MYLLVLAITLLVLYASYRYIKNARVLSHIPGPRGVPIFGNLFQLQVERPHLYLADVGKQYQDVFKLTLAGQNVVVVNDPKAVYEVLVQKGKEFGSKPQSFRQWKASFGCSMLSFMPLGPDFDLMKKAIHAHVKTYTPKGMKSIESFTTRCIEETIRELSELDEKPIAFFPVLRTLVIKISHIMLFDKALDDEEEILDIHNYVTDFQAVLEYGGGGELLDKFPWLRFFGHPTWQKLKQLEDKGTALFNKWHQDFQDRKAKGEDVEHNFLSPMLQMAERGDITQNQVIGVTLEMFFAAVATTSGTLGCLFNVLVHHPDIQKRLQSEVDELDGPIRFQDRSKLIYHHACIMETTRYGAPSPMTDPHLATTDTDILGFPVPQNTEVWINLWAVAHNTSIYDLPSTFSPERYLGDDGAVVSADHPHRKYNLAFSAGPRVCPGEVFAKTRLLLVLAYFMRAFEVLPGSTLEEQPSCAGEDLIAGFVLSPPDYRVRLRKRTKSSI